jgi:hypothetical protein
MRFLALSLLLAACDLWQPSAASDDCALVQQIFQSCGATVPLLTDGACTGLRRALAECVLEQDTTCDGLAAFSRRRDVCLPTIQELSGVKNAGSNDIFGPSPDAGSALDGGY